MLWKIRDERHTQPNTIYGYDERHRLVSVTQKQQLLGGADLVTSYGYDAHDNLVSVTDPNLNVTTYVYDDFGRLRTQVSPVSGTTSYTYDPAGNLVTSADAVLASTTRTYDAANRITSAASTKPGAISETVTWQYDDTTSAAYRRGRLWRMTDPTGSVEYAYERRGLLRQEARVLYGTPYGQGYAHDADGNRSQVTYPSGRVVAFGFDFAGRPITAGATAPTARSYVAAATYYPFGPRRTLSLGNGTLQAKGYDQRYQLTQNGYRRGPLTWYFDQAIDPDASGNVLSVTEGYAGFGDRAFTYDDLSRLRRADAPYQWGVDSTNGYTYDAMGNLLSLRLGATRTASFAHSGSTPLLTSVTENGTPTSVSYDDAGSIDLIGSTTYGTSARGYLEGIDNGISYAYDGAGLRRRRLVKDSEKSRYYFYTPDLHLLSESALASGSPGLAEDYVWLGDTPVAHETLGNGNTEWFATDSLGTPILGTDSSKEETFRLELEPYGRVWWISQNKTKLDRRILRYPGQEQEDDTPPLRDRYYNVFRWYLPAWGRYSQPDPVGLAGGLNQFAYALGRPTTLVDRLGLDVWICNRQVRGAVPIGNHAYFWDDTTKRACGQSATWGAGNPLGDANEAGAPIDQCVVIPGSRGREPDVMRCCQDTANSGKVYFPGIKDCHTALAQCIDGLGLGEATAIGGRTGSCRSCWVQPLLARLRQAFLLFEAAGNPAGEPANPGWPWPKP